MKFKKLWAGFMPTLADKIVKDAAADAAIVLDKNGIILALNEKFVNIYDIPNELSLIGESFNKIMDICNEGSIFTDAYKHTLETSENTVTLGFSNKYENWIVARTHFYQNKYVVLLFNTVNDNYKSNIFYNNYDFLTMVPNRIFFENDLKRLETESPIYILFDLKRFHVLNETLGSFVGDETLKETTRRLKSCLSKRGLIYRIAGDQFMLLIPDKEKEDLLKDIKMKMTEEFNIKNHKFFINYVLGIYIPSGDEHFNKALYYTELALIKGKSLKQKMTTFEANMVSNKETLQMEKDLIEAIKYKKNQFIIKYQLQYCLDTNNVCGAEALIRWEHPENGMVNVDKFLKVAQDIGLMASIDRIVFDKVIEDAKDFKLLDIDLPISINLSAQGVINETLQSHILNVLKESNHRVHFELTETEWIDSGKCHNFLDNIRNLNHEIAIDDFGVGYSSFEYLLNYPTDVIKIDKKFIRDICKNKTNQTIVSNIIKMGKGLDVKLVAEGVETLDELEWLIKNGCNMVQGFYFFKPEIKEIVFSYFKSSGENMPKIIKDLQKSQLTIA